MTRFPEQALYDDLAAAMAPHWFAKRIEDRIGSGLPDLTFAGKRKRFAWMELKVLPKIPQENRLFDIPHFEAAQRAFGLEALRCGGASSWWLMTRLADVDHLHRATIIDEMTEGIKYSAWRNKAAWVGRITPASATAIAKVILG